MNSEQLEAFVYTVYLKSTNKAAKALFISQPTVTARIQSLEKELGRALFERNGKSLELNLYGQEYFKYAQQILQMVKEGKDRLQMELNRQEIKIGANLISSQYLIPYVLSQWQDENPSIKYHLHAGSNDELVVQLLNQQIDVAIMRKNDSERIVQRVITQNSIELTVSPEHPFAKRASLRLDELITEPLVFFACGAFDWEWLYKIFQTSALEPFIKYRVDHIEVAKSFITAKRAIGFLPELCMKKELAMKTLVKVKVEMFPQLTQPIYLSMLKDKSFKDYNTIASSLLNFEQHIKFIDNEKEKVN